MFHKEGHRIIIASFFFTISVIISSDILIGPENIKIILQSGFLFFYSMILWFFRNPKRNIIIDDNVILSPADGKIVDIKEVNENEFFKDDRIKISIFLSITNIHVTRFPISGKIIYNKYHPGKYLLAWHPKSSEKNERTSVVISNNSFGNILYRQIAGAVARRIINYAKTNLEVIQGEDSGFIKFGSRVDIFLPLNSNISVKKGQNVKGGITILSIKN
ncbi:MAG: phosphatidylserine decarboxylase family protein [Flavobacteriales bacterium]|jgi:phosphatidylserine decarboxylase|nr:phosphatidylserine decarboxylase family protein [Flavobacteriales bacterium]|tara:strand:+ start:199 stop:852 length:654 start_codon:yes stop_codon:yes gene_type:complete